MMQKQHTKRIFYIDLLNIVASFSVVAMHCNGIVHSYSNTLAWKQSLIVEVLAYWAVPIFFMISGATLLNYHTKYSTDVFIKKRITRTLMPFFIWSMLALVYKIIVGSMEISALSIPEFISMLFTSKFEGVYWFFIPLFASYMCIPVLSYLSRETNKYLVYMFGCGIVTISFLPFVCSIFNIEFNSAISFPLTGGYVLFVIEGYLLSRITISRKTRIGIYLLGFIGIIARYAGTVYLSQQYGELNQLYWGYLNWPSLFLATSVFVFFQYGEWSILEKNKVVCALVSEVSGACFGIYLVHMFVLHILNDVFKINTNGWEWRTVGIFLVYIIALVIVKIIQRIPIIKKIIP